MSQQYELYFNPTTDADYIEINYASRRRLIQNDLSSLLSPQNFTERKPAGLVLLRKPILGIEAHIRNKPLLKEFFKKSLNRMPRNFQRYVMQVKRKNESYGNKDEFSFSLDLGFALPTSSEPVVSIVIPVHNNWWATYACLRSIQSGMNKTPFEVIVVDDFSSDMTVQALRNLRGLTVVRNKSNLGYLYSTNLGASKASVTSRYILTLNNDTVPGIDWIDELYSVCESDSNIAIAGSCLVYPDGTLQEAGSQIFKDGSGWNLGRGENFPNPMHSNLREVDYCSAASILIKKDFWEKNGGFDIRFAPAYYEDTDLAFSARALGYKVVCVPTSIVIHHEGLSHGTSVASGLKSYQEINRGKFLAKWGKVLEQHWENKGIPRVEHARNSLGIIVLIDQQLPSPRRDSGSIRTVRLIKHFSDLGFHVILGALDSSTSESDLFPLRKMGVEIHQSIDVLFDSLKPRLPRLYAIWIVRPNVIEEVQPRLTILESSTIIVGDLLDLPPHEAQKLKLDAQSIRIAKSVDKCVLVSKLEADFMKYNGFSNVEYVWHDFMFQEINREWETSSGAIFVGGFRHKPNVEGLTWFINEVMPIIRKKDPSFRVRIVGSGCTPDFEKLMADQGLEYLGRLDDLSLIYKTSKMAIVPLLSGAGMKGKLAESFAFGLPAVSTSIGAEGFQLDTYSTPVLIKDTPEDFANACLALNVDEEMNSMMSEHAKTYTARYLSEDFVKEQIQSVLNLR